MKSIIVTFADGQQIPTRINGTVQSICDYYYNGVFNLGHIKDNVQAVTKIEFVTWE